jgi:hypothetical protein
MFETLLYKKFDYWNTLETYKTYRTYLSIVISQQHKHGILPGMSKHVVCRGARSVIGT